MIGKHAAFLGAAIASAHFAMAFSSASAAELHRAKFAQWGDPLTPPQSRTDCAKWFKTDHPIHVKTCVGTRTQWRHIEVQAYVVTDGPANLAGDIQRAIVNCTIIAAGAAAGFGTATVGVGALPAAKVAFSACMAQRVSDIAGQYSVHFDTQTHWTDWA